MAPGTNQTMSIFIYLFLFMPILRHAQKEMYFLTFFLTDYNDINFPDLRLILKR